MGKRFISFLFICIVILFFNIIYAQETRPGFIRAEIGLSRMQYEAGNGYAAALRFGKSLSYNNTLRFDSGITLSTPESFFVSADAGIELRLPSTRQIIPFLGLGVGLLPYGNVAFMMRVNTGIDFILNPKTSVRLNLQAGSIGIGEEGLYLFTIGLERKPDNIFKSLAQVGKVSMGCLVTLIAALVLLSR